MASKGQALIHLASPPSFVHSFPHFCILLTISFLTELLVIAFFKLYMKSFSSRSTSTPQRLAITL